MTRVAFAHYSSRSDISGVTSWLERIAIRLQRDGVAVGVHLHHLGQDTANATIALSLRNAGVYVDVVPRGPDLAADTRKTLAFLDAFKPDVFLPQCLCGHCFAAALAGGRGLPWVLTMHSDEPDYWAIANARPPRASAGKTVCVSEHIANQVRERRIDLDPYVIPCGVSPPSVMAEYRHDPFRVVYSGRLVETQKRMSLVIETLIQACRSDSGLAGTIVGDGAARSECERRVQAEGLGDRITFTGRLSNDEVRRVVGGSQAILLMSDYEGLPVAILEAMAAGVVPVVRSIPSGIPELVKHESSGLLVTDDPGDASAALVRLANDAALWQRCSTAAMSLVEANYSEDQSYRQWRNVIEELASTTNILYPLNIRGDLGLPLDDPQFTNTYPPIPPPMRRLYFWVRSRVGRLKRGITRVGRAVLRRS